MTLTNNTKTTIALLRDLYPKAFGLPVQPLAIGTKEALTAALELDEIGQKRLFKALAAHCTSSWYLVAVADGRERVDLDGKPQGAPTAEQRVDAIKRMTERRAQIAAKRYAAALELDRQADIARDKEEAGKGKSKGKPAQVPATKPGTVVANAAALAARRGERAPSVQPGRLRPQLKLKAKT